MSSVKCPKCGTDIPYAVDTRKIGGKGGKASGSRKARTTAQATAAVEARWAKYRAKKAKA
jgi:hypothetical protein